MRLGWELEIEQLGLGMALEQFDWEQEEQSKEMQRLERLKLIWELVCFVGFLFLFPFFFWCGSNLGNNQTRPDNFG